MWNFSVLKMEKINEWSLEKYRTARSLSANSDKDWEPFDNGKENLSLCITNCDQLLLSAGRTILESHSLRGMREGMRGMAKGDSLLIVVQTASLTRQFKMKFAPGAPAMPPQDQCRACADVLAKYFPVKIHSPLSQTLTQPITVQRDRRYMPVTDTRESSMPGSCTGNVLSGVVTLGDISQSVLDQSTHPLPAVYTKLGGPTLTSADLDTYIRMCLTDPSFPAFVADVEKSLKDLVINEQ